MERIYGKKRFFNLRMKKVVATSCEYSNCAL